MNNKSHKDAARRAARTATQSGFAAGVISLLIEFDVINWTPQQITAVLFVGTPFVSYVQNWLENKLGFAFLVQKATPDPEPTEGEVEPFDWDSDEEGAEVEEAPEDEVVDEEDVSDALDLDELDVADDADPEAVEVDPDPVAEWGEGHTGNPEEDPSLEVVEPEPKKPAKPRRKKRR